MIGKPASRKAYKLLHDGVLTMSKVEAAGMRIDTKYLDKTIKEVKEKIEEKKQKLQRHKFYKTWKKLHGDKTKISADKQLVEVLIAEGLMKEVQLTASGKIKSDEKILGKLDHPFVEEFLNIKKLIKANSTYLSGIKRELVDGYIHPIFDLHIPISYRGSCSRPNGYNFPKRNEEMARLVRQAFIPRKGHVLVELDFKGIEVCIAACYNKDPNLIEYVKDPTKDMHRDTAAQLFMCPIDQVSKMMRFYAKNQFVFAEFYGSVYQQCTPTLWDSVQRAGLELEDGTDLRKHLKKQGIKGKGACEFDHSPRKGTFEAHVRKVEESFWSDRFKVYARWKQTWWEKYLERGYVEYYTGFVARGLYKRNEIINIPIQGAAFHCLLWCEIQLVKWMIKNKMKSRIVNQVYDSLICDIHETELEDFLQYTTYLMKEAVMKHWEWIIVPLEVECEVSDKNWYEMKERKI